MFLQFNGGLARWWAMFLFLPTISLCGPHNSCWCNSGGTFCLHSLALPLSQWPVQVWGIYTRDFSFVVSDIFWEHIPCPGVVSFVVCLSCPISFVAQTSCHYQMGEVIAGGHSRHAQRPDTWEIKICCLCYSCENIWCSSKHLRT